MQESITARIVNTRLAPHAHFLAGSGDRSAVTSVLRDQAAASASVGRRSWGRLRVPGTSMATLAA